MSSHSWLFASDVSPSPARSLELQRRSDEIAAETFAQAEKRRLAIEQLSSTLYSPQERINAWEKLHGLKLPFKAQHPILASIARGTGLTLAQVLEEQEARNGKAGNAVQLPAVYG